ncbi:MAG: LptF/LptG family permease [Verrucomicrobiota bacterium]|nr:LptF/LptG family permease [Verrucomicrobiota bacterium]
MFQSTHTKVMRLLDRYLTRELMIPLIYCIAGFLIFWIAFDWLGSAEDFQDAHMKFGAILKYYWIKIPEFLTVILPITLLLALLYTLTHLARNNELIAMRAAGVSWWRLCMPFFCIGIVMSLGLFLINEKWGAESANASTLMMEKYRKGSQGSSEHEWHQQVFFHNHRDQRKWFVNRYNAETAVMMNPFVVDAGSTKKGYRIEAESARWTNSVWTFYGAKEMFIEPSGTVEGVISHSHDILEKPSFSETPAQFRSELKIANMSSVRMAKQAQLSLTEIHNYYQLHPEVPSAMRPKLATQYHGRIAWPWTCLVVVLIAIPFGAPSGRRNVFAGIAMSIFFCFGYFILMRFALALGTRGSLSPWLAAWFPNLVFGGTSLWFIRRIR